MLGSHEVFVWGRGSNWGKPEEETQWRKQKKKAGEPNGDSRYFNQDDSDFQIAARETRFELLITFQYSGCQGDNR